MNGWIPIVISSIALGVTVTSAWLTWFRKGKLRMTQPTVIFFGPDGGSRSSGRKHLKVFLRTLLYSTANRGQTIESLYVNLQRDELRQTFRSGFMVTSNSLEEVVCSFQRKELHATTISYCPKTKPNSSFKLVSTFSVSMLSRQIEQLQGS